MELSAADGRLGAVSDAAPELAEEPQWVRNWKRTVRMQRELREADMARRRTRERQYCEAIRDAKAEGRTPPTAEEFFAR